MKSFISALTFLTIIPAPKGQDYSENFKDCEKYFPLVGIIIGLIVGFGSYLSYQIFPALVAAVISVILLVKITGGLHIDGLSDTVDGFYSHRSKDKILEIMKDSCIGSMGSVGQICLFFLKVSAVYELSSNAYLALFVAPIVGRTAILYISYNFKPANTTGLGFAINSSVSKRSMSFGVVISLFASYLLFGFTGIIAVVIALATVHLLGKMSKKKIGGFTGDVLGASCEIGEAITLVILSTY